MSGTQSFIRTLLVLATLLPLFSSIAVILVGRKRLPGNKTGVFAVGAMGLSFLCCLLAMLLWVSQGEPQAIVWNVPWLPVGDGQWLSLGVLVDGVTVAMMLMVSLISTLVHVYSIGYMKGDKRFERFFAYLSLFTFSMMGIVTANGLLQLFVFWELVGFTSYLLIGFWFENKGPQLACKKAFVMNRVGDAGFLIGFGILFWKVGAEVLLPWGEAATSADGAVTTMWGAIQSVLENETQAALAAGTLAEGEAYTISNPPGWLTAAGIGLFFGAIGKSAQFPLHTWLPDAMEGPTPVSSIVHSATMVAAGVYLTARIYPILTPGAHLFIATIGLITLVMAALMALVMTDIKRVLAYSTLSQLGYMILGLGTGAYVFALYHLFTHAFFKCCLFQCSGSVINAAHHQQDMRYYGGLKDKLPKTALAYFICTLAIAGASVPLLSLLHVNIGLSGFYSKDGIIAGTYDYGAGLGGLAMLFYIGPMVVAYITAFYMARSFALTFLGKPRDQHLYDHAEEAPMTMVGPQFVLAGLAVVSFPFFIWLPLIEQTLSAPAGAGVIAPTEHSMHVVHWVLLQGLGWIIALGAGIWMYKDGFAKADKLASLPVFKQLHAWFKNKFYFDALYDNVAVNLTKAVAIFAAGFDKFIVDGLVNLAGYATRGWAWLVGRFDKKAVDGAVDGAATFAWNMGGLLRHTQIGKLRGYVMIVLGSACLLTIMVIAIVIVNKNVA